MDLREMIKKIILEQIDKDAILEIKYDEQENIYGYVASDNFENITESEKSKIIWSNLKKTLSKKDQLKILTLYPETKIERLKRVGSINEKKDNNIVKSKYWIHISKDDSKYYAFIDVIKEKMEYKAFYLVINAAYKYYSGNIITYAAEVVNFMSINREDVYNEILINALENAKTQIRMHLMTLFEKTKKDKKYSNIYKYVYTDFSINPLQVSNILFTKEECLLIEEQISKVFNCKVKTELLNNIKMIKFESI